jgi:DNA-binding HxlR family transcriptional regulator
MSTTVNSIQRPRQRIAAGPLDILSRRYSLQILSRLRKGPKHFNELVRLVEGISPNPLRSRLKMLRTSGIVKREVMSVMPSLVRYSLTPKGSELAEIVAGIERWEDQWRERQPT